MIPSFQAQQSAPPKLAGGCGDMPEMSHATYCSGADPQIGTIKPCATYLHCWICAWIEARSAAQSVCLADTVAYCLSICTLALTRFDRPGVLAH